MLQFIVNLPHPEFSIFWICFIFQAFSSFSVLWHSVCNSTGTISASWFNFLVQTRPRLLVASVRITVVTQRIHISLWYIFSSMYIAPNNPNDIFMHKKIHIHFTVLCSDIFGNGIWQCFSQEEQNRERSRRNGGARYSSPYTKFPWFSETKSTWRGSMKLWKCLSAFPELAPPTLPSQWLFPELCITHNDTDSHLQIKLLNYRRLIRDCP